MKNHASASSRTPGRSRPRKPADLIPAGRLTALRVRRAFGREDVPPVEEMERRRREGTSFLASLTPEQLAFIREYDGPVSFGITAPKRVRGKDADAA